MADKFWYDVQIDVQSALGTAQTVTAISKASPGVVSHDGASLTDGDYVLMSASGMVQLDDRVVRADSPSVSPGEFNLEGIDTTNYGTFVSGSFQPITFGTSLGTIREVVTSGGEPEYEDTSVVHRRVRTQTPTVTSPFTVTMTSKWDPSDAALLLLLAASEVNAERCVRVTLSDGSKFTFNATVVCTMLPQGQFPGLVTTQIVFSAKGLNTILPD